MSGHAGGEELSPELLRATLLRLLRAQDGSGVWDGIADEALLAPFILTREQRQALPLIADPDPKALWRMEMFYTAVGMVIERCAGRIASPVFRLHNEGWGRLVLLAGRLVVVSVSLRDLHRFGFPSEDALLKKGCALAQEGIAWIARFPEVADA